MLKFKYYVALIAIILASAPVARADAVTERMKGAIEECVLQNVSRYGSPLADANQWAEVVSASFALSYSIIQLVGYEDHEGFEEAMRVRTRNTLISTLEDKGYTAFRTQTIETINYCLPFGLAAAAEEMERQENAVCPDDTEYLSSVETLTSSTAELRDTYGDSATQIKELGLTMIKLQLLEFSQIFRYGQDEYPHFTGDGPIEGVHNALSQIDLENVSEARPFINAALEDIRLVDDKTDRMRELEAELICIKDWLDVYPAEAIEKLERTD